MSDAGIAQLTLVVLVLAIAAGVALLARLVHVPYTVALLLGGIVAASALPSLRLVPTPGLLLGILLPGLLFDAGVRLDAAELRRRMSGIAALAVLGVLATAVLVAYALSVLTGLPFALGLLLGAMVSATDPVAVIATFRGERTPAGLRTFVEAESLFNDGTSLVLYSLALSSLASTTDSVSTAAASFVAVLVASIVIGAACGVAASWLIGSIDDHLIELLISFAVAYGTFLIATLAHQSGVIATVVAALVLGAYGRPRAMSANTQAAFDVVWEFAGFLLTAVAFLLIGFAVSLPSLASVIGPILVTFVAVLLARAAAVYGLVGLESLAFPKRHARLSLSWLHVLFWAGLRGAVSVAMALALPTDLPQRDLLQQITFGVVIITIVLQGTTAHWVVMRVPATAS